MPAAAAAPAAGAIMLFCFFRAQLFFYAAARGAAAVISSPLLGLMIDSCPSVLSAGLGRLPPGTDFLPGGLLPSVLQATSNHETILVAGCVKKRERRLSAARKPRAASLVGRSREESLVPDLTQEHRARVRASDN